MPTSPSWFADERLWEVSYPFLFTAERFEEATDQIGQILTLAGVSSGSAFDLACGPGRHASALSQAGFSVTGVDRSLFLLSKARARDEESSVEWVQGDMREFSRPDEYDLAVSLLTSFGYFDADEDNRRVLSNVLASVKPGAPFVLDVMPKEVIAKIFQPVAATEIEGTGTRVERRRVTDDWCRMANEWTYILADDTVERFHVTHWIYSARELRDMLTDAGFGRVSCYADFEGAPYDLGANRLVIVAWKPDA